MQYTIVQHSGYGYGGNLGFSRAVETREVTPAVAKRVEKAGGVVFESYTSAEDFAEQANYPDDVGGLYPRVKGAFATLQVDGLRVYIPVRQVVG